MDLVAAERCLDRRFGRGTLVLEVLLRMEPPETLQLRHDLGRDGAPVERVATVAPDRPQRLRQGRHAMEITFGRRATAGQEGGSGIGIAREASPVVHPIGGDPRRDPEPFFGSLDGRGQQGFERPAAVILVEATPRIDAARDRHRMG